VKLGGKGHNFEPGGREGKKKNRFATRADIDGVQEAGVRGRKKERIKDELRTLPRSDDSPDSEAGVYKKKESTSRIGCAHDSDHNGGC